MGAIITIHMIVGSLAIVALVVAAAYMIGSKSENTWGGMKVVFSATTGLLDLQFLLGFILVIWLSLAGAIVNWVHVVMMLVAVIAAHLASKTREKSRRNAMVLIILALVLVLIGSGIVR